MGASWTAGGVRTHTGRCTGEDYPLSTVRGPDPVVDKGGPLRTDSLEPDPGGDEGEIRSRGRSDRNERSRGL